MPAAGALRLHSHVALMHDLIGLLLGVLGPILAFVFMLTPLIVVHELGHLIAARKFGVNAPEFGIGFPPRIATFFKDAKTELTINAIPIGGFVRLAGAEEGDRRPGGWNHASLRAKIAIMVAGVAMNFFAAIIILTIVFGPMSERAEVYLAEVQAESPAATAGMVPGDRLTAINDVVLEMQGAPLSNLRNLAGEEVSVTLLHADGRAETVTVYLRTLDEAKDRGVLGVTIEKVIAAGPLNRGLPDAVRMAVWESASVASGLLDALWKLASSPFQNDADAPALSGPIGLSVVVAENAGRLGIAGLLHFAGILSVNLAVLNILPIPPLDGGRVATVVLRRALGERRGVRAERNLQIVGLALMLLLFSWITLGDVLGLIGRN